MHRLALVACASAAAVGASAALPILPHHPAIERHRAEVGEWRLDIARNPFSGEIVCRLRARDKRATYQASAIGFRFKKGWNVAEAVYRIDGGVPRRSRDDRPTLIALGAPIDSGPFDSPSRGIVWIPFRTLADANSVAVQARPDRRARVFHFRGLRGLMEVARARGCVSDNRFGP